MNVVFCGTSSGGMSFNPDRANASVFLEDGGSGVLLDCGPGSLERLIRAGRTLNDVHAVFFSHMHHDHVLAWPEILMRRTFPGSSGPPPVYGPTGTAELMKRAGHFVELLAARPGASFDPDGVVEELAPGGSVSVGSLTATCVEVPHAPELQCFAWKLSSRGATVVYSGDTSPAPDVMVPFARDADLLIHDAYSSDTLSARLAQASPEVRELASRIVPTTHSEVRSVGPIAEAAGVKRLVLTAILPTEDTELLAQQAADGFSGEVIVAYDGLSLEV